MAHDPISDLKRYAAALEAQVSGERSRQAARAALHTPSPRRAPRRTVVAIAATVLMGISNVALAAVADPAVPGDALYGVDRAYERVGALVGFDTTNAGERAAEVMVLQERGKSAEALKLLQETLTKLVESDDPEAAVEELTAGLGNDADFKAMIAELVATAQAVDTTGPDVAAIARSIVERIQLPQQAQDNSKRPDTVPGHEDNPGPPEHAGPPEDKGPPVTPGQGSQGNTGRNGGQP